jgi:hypothetical protein
MSEPTPAQSVAAPQGPPPAVSGSTNPVPGPAQPAPAPSSSNNGNTPASGVASPPVCQPLPASKPKSMETELPKVSQPPMTSNGNLSTPPAPETSPRKAASPLPPPRSSVGPPPPTTARVGPPPPTGARVGPPPPTGARVGPVFSRPAIGPPPPTGARVAPLIPKL